MTVTHFPAPEKREMLIGPFEEWRVVLDGKGIPLLTGNKLPNGRVWLMLDNRFGGEFSEEDAWQVAHLVANALAIGQGYPSYMATTKDRPFAPFITELPSDGSSPQTDPSHDR